MLQKSDKLTELHKIVLKKLEIEAKHRQALIEIDNLKERNNKL